MDASYTYKWSCVRSEAEWTPRDGAQLVSFKGRLFLLGGWNSYPEVLAAGSSSQVCSQVWSSEDGASWSLATVAPWTGRHCMGAVVHDDFLWVVGAENPDPDDVWRSADGVEWELVTDDVPWNDRANHLVTVFDGSIWVMGGQTGAPSQSQFVEDVAAGKKSSPAPPPLRDVWRSDDGVHWRLVTDNAPCFPRGMITGANGGIPILHGRMWILGGGYVGENATTLSSLKYDLQEQPRLQARLYYNDVWSSADGQVWERHLEEAPWAARSYLDVATWDDKLWVLGGHCGVAENAAEVGNDGNRNDVWYSADGENWHELPHTPWSLRHACGVFQHRGALFLAAGSAVRISEEEVAKSRADHKYSPEHVWLPGDVWRLDAVRGGQS